MEFFPLDLPGPQFLVFYPLFALCVAAIVRSLRPRLEATQEGVFPSLNDPYRIALLRDGRREAVRIAVLALVERGVLAIKPDKTIGVADGAGGSLENPLENALLRFFSAGGGPESAADETAVKAVTTAMQANLEAQGLLSSVGGRASRIVAAVTIPLAIALLRIHHSGPPGNLAPHGYLVAEMFGCGLLAAFIAHRRVTALGRATLQHLEALLGQAISRAREPSSPATGNEVPLLAATFGVAASSGILAGQPEWLHSKIESIGEVLDFLRDNSKHHGAGCGAAGDCGGCGGCGGD